MDNREVVGIQWVAVKSMRQMILIAHLSQSVNVCAIVGMEIDGCME